MKKFLTATGESGTMDGDSSRATAGASTPSRVARQLSLGSESEVKELPATMPKNPSFLFYPGDWLKDPELRSCSPAARGVWIDIICLMSQCKEIGVLSTDGVAWNEERIARAVGGSDIAVTKALQELIEGGVLKRDRRGFFYSKRLIEIANEREKWRKRQKNHRDNNNDRHADVTAKSRPSSSSVSSSEVKTKPTAAAPPNFSVPIPEHLKPSMAQMDFSKEANKRNFDLLMNEARRIAAKKSV